MNIMKLNLIEAFMHTSNYMQGNELSMNSCVLKLGPNYPSSGSGHISCDLGHPQLPTHCLILLSDEPGKEKQIAAGGTVFLTEAGDV